MLIEFKKTELHPLILNILLDCSFEPFCPLLWRECGVGFEGIDESWGKECKSGIEGVKSKFEGFDMS